MRATRHALALAGTLALLGCDNLAVVNRGESACDLAAQHIAECNSQSVQPVTSCDAQAEAEANTILGMDCPALAILATHEGRSTTTQKCTDKEQAVCEVLCVEALAKFGLRLRRATCEVLEPGEEKDDGDVVEENTVHCECKIAWF